MIPSDINYGNVAKLVIRAIERYLKKLFCFKRSQIPPETHFSLKKLKYNVIILVLL